MIYTSLAVLAMSASAAVSPFSHLIHMHPHAVAVDSRVRVMIYNKSESFCDLNVDGKTYTVLAHHALEVKAPAGTVVYAASNMPFKKKGDAVLEVKSEMNNRQISIN